DLVTTRVQRQLAHLLSHAGDYIGARAAAEQTVKHAARLSDPAEAAWATYTVGFVDWFGGRLDGAVDAFTKAEAELRQYGSSVWRHTLLCLARAKLERGELTEGERLAKQSATGAAEDHGHIALLRNEAEVADLILTRAGKGLPEDEQFRDFVRAIVTAKKGDPRSVTRRRRRSAVRSGRAPKPHSSARRPTLAKVRAPRRSTRPRSVCARWASPGGRSGSCARWSSSPATVSVLTATRSRSGSGSRQTRCACTSLGSARSSTSPRSEATRCCSRRRSPGVRVSP